MKNMIINRTMALIALAAIIILSGCEKESNQGPRLGLEFETVKTGLMLAALKSTNGELVFTSGAIHFEDVEFEAESEDGLV
ncbi:MAG: hypothetical protein RQ743_06435 [Bacteroidales bacterium]|nr:hypothetical protein [Bacteroidales bacterium]